MTADARFERARRIADAVLLEGYVLYPYRASSTKNRWRWSFGVLAPRAWSEAGGCEPWWMEAQCLLAPGDAPRLRARLRFMQDRRREVEEAVCGGEAFRPVEALDVDGRLVVAWDEGEVRELDLDVPLVPGAAPRELALEVPGGEEAAPVSAASGALAGRIVRRCSPMEVRVIARCEAIAADRPLLRVSIRVENETRWDEPGAPREAALRASCLGAHLVLAAEGGELLSLLDPPEFARDAARACRNVRVFPVLAGEAGEGDLVLASPIILYDHPRVAPESPGDFFDATEIDELLALRTATLTDDEKREARATDARAAAVVDRVDAMPPEVLARLHGTARELLGAEMIPRVAPPVAPGFRPGDRVRLRPGVRRTDAQDLLYAGRTATVREVKRDVDGRECLAVTVDGDPAAELHHWYGRYHHFFTDEVERLGPAGEGAQ